MIWTWIPLYSKPSLIQSDEGEVSSITEAKDIPKRQKNSNHKEMENLTI
jgi:hypothetical protein